MNLAPPFEIDSVIGGKYRVIREIGQGGLGVVYEAEHLRLEQRVAIKVLAVHRARSELVMRFEREARVMARLKSEHVATVHDVDVLPNGAPYIVMELLAGWDLHQELERCGGVIDTDEAVRIALGAAEGVAQAHEAGIVHRDLKPSNLFLVPTRDGRAVKLLDFGVSKVRDDDARTVEMTGTGAMLGTTAYMSPEQVQSSRKVDARSDLWSLGVILFRMLTGELPFRGDGSIATALAIVSDAPRSLADGRDDLPPSLVAIVQRLLQKDPNKRFQTARELIFALSHVDAEEAASVDRDATIVRAPARPMTPLAVVMPSAASWDAAVPRDTPSSTQHVVLTSVATVETPPVRPRRRAFGTFISLVAVITLGGAVFVWREPARAQAFRPSFERMLSSVRLGQWTRGPLPRASAVVPASAAPPLEATVDEATDAGSTATETDAN